MKTQKIIVEYTIYKSTTTEHETRPGVIGVIGIPSVTLLEKAPLEILPLSKGIKGIK